MRARAPARPAVKVTKTRHAIFLAVTLIMNLRSVALGGVGSFMATKTRYTQRVLIPNAPSVYETPDPQGYHASLLWVLSRHGTRWPTTGRAKQMELLSGTFKDARNLEQYPWMQGWVSPTQGMDDACGELHPVGEDELWSLAWRMRARFPSVLRSEYLPRRYNIVSTQVPRAAASASAFAAGFFPSIPITGDEQPAEPSSETHLNTAALRTILSHIQHINNDTSSLINSNGSSNGSCNGSSSSVMGSRGSTAVSDVSAGGGGGNGAAVGGSNEADATRTRRRPQAVAVSMAPKDNDPLLRFFDICPAYAQRTEWLEKWLSSWLAGQWSALAPALEKRLGMTRPLGACEVEALYTLCQFEAGVLGVTDKCCKVFDEQQLAVMEWLDDVNLLESHGYGSPVNYRIAAPLLQDLRATLQHAAGISPSGMVASGGAPHARLLFAHCETLVPLATLLGLFEPELPPTPQHIQEPDATELAQAAPMEEAMQLIQQEDAIEDLTMHIQQQQQAALKEGVETCNDMVPPPRVAPPRGWFPRTPFNESRRFRGGRVSPFGANVALVLYKKTNHSSGDRLYRVRLLWNEQVIRLPLCRPVGEASAEDPTAHLDCTLDEFLAVTEAAAGGKHTLDRWCSPPNPAGAAAA